MSPCMATLPPPALFSGQGPLSEELGPRSPGRTLSLDTPVLSWGPGHLLPLWISKEVCTALWAAGTPWLVNCLC